MSQPFSIRIDKANRTAWDQALLRVPSAYQQDWAYGEVMKRLGNRVHRIELMDAREEVCGLALLVLRRIGLVGTFALCSYGPVWVKPISPSEQAAALRALRNALSIRWPRLVAFTLDQAEPPAGFHRILTGDATVRIDLSQDEEALRKALDGKWRNRLVAAEKSDLRFSPSGTKPGQYEWLIVEEIKQRKKKGYRGLPPGLTTAWQEEKAKAQGADRKVGIAVFRADLKRAPAAAMLFLTHGQTATYHIGWNAEEGRTLSAHNLVLWNAMLALKAKGIRTLDLGGVDTVSGAGIARFKLGTGGEVILRPGTFV